MSNLLSIIKNVVPVPLLGPIINTVELISIGILGVRANKVNFKAFGERLCLFAVTLNEHAKTKGPDGDIPAAIKDNVQAITQLVEQIEEYVVRQSRMNIMRQFFETCRYYSPSRAFRSATYILYTKSTIAYPI
ncbi:hypothetical protein BASA60_002890 [Batrachochytrium salamandrivorans]|nr:hypothetical protein BASA60_002890 [Batrachochytrium salamandrivorans]